MSEIDTAALRRIAEKATQGPWTVDGPAQNQIVWSTPNNRVCFLAHSAGQDPARDYATGAHIATFDPPTAISLLDEIDRLRAEVERLDANAIAADECMKSYQRDVDAHLVSPRDVEIASLRAALAEAVEVLGNFVSHPSNLATRDRARAIVAKHGVTPMAARNTVTITVSGPVGSGKSAICGEIEIALLAIGVPVSWDDEGEKNTTHADWAVALEMYRPTVRIVEEVRHV